jgi:DNA-binding response OmpR family regulator
VLAAVDCFFALKGQGVLGDELEAHLRAEAGKRLDPRAVEAVLRAERAERLVDHLGSEGERVVIVDPDPVASSLLQMRLANAGFHVEVHRDGEKALASILGRVPDLILSEIALPAIDGFSLLLRLRKAEPTREVPFVFVSERKDRGSSMRGFDLGADDFVQKPADLELLVAKAKGMIRKARSRRPAGIVDPGGISGNLSEMGIVDLLQILSASRRTVRVKVEDGKGSSGELSLLNGRPVDARRGEVVGDDALYQLIDWSEGRFTVQTAEPPAEQTITATLEGLLIEACRRRDEAKRDA